jgi:hypothetical protein
MSVIMWATIRKEAWVTTPTQVIGTPAQVIGKNVKRLRGSMPAEQFGTRIGEILGKPWPRQTVYLLEQGEHKLIAEEVVAISTVLGTPIADLFTPPAEVDQVKVGRRLVSREQLLTGQQAGEQLYEIARHTQALMRSIKDLNELVAAQRLVIENIERAGRGEPPIKPGVKAPLSRSGQQPTFEQVSARWLRAEYERAQRWYEPEQPLPEWLKGDEQ